MKKEIKLGQKVKDIVSDFTGIVIARTKYLNGCIQFQVQAKKTIKDGVVNMDIDEEQLEIVNEGILKKKKVTNTGGPKKLSVSNSTYRT